MFLHKQGWEMCFLCMFLPFFSFSFFFLVFFIFLQTILLKASKITQGKRSGAIMCYFSIQLMMHFSSLGNKETRLSQ